jgi:hypothetical protein
MFIAALLFAAVSGAQPACHQYDGAVFSGRIRHLRLRRSTPHDWSAEDPDCDRFFFPAKLSPSIDRKLAQRITVTVNRLHGDDYLELDAQVQIRMDADHAGGILTVVALPARR